MPDDTISIITTGEMSDSEDKESVQNGDGPSSRPPTQDDSHVSSRKHAKRKRNVVSESESSSSESEDSNSDSESASSSDSDLSSRGSAVRSVVSETISSVTSYERFNPTTASKRSNCCLSTEQLKYAKKQFTEYVKDDVVDASIMATAPIPDDPVFQCKQLDDFVAPSLQKVGVELDRGAEKGIQGIQKRILRTMGPVSRLWALLDNIREKSRNNDQVDEVDINTMCQYVEKTVCVLGQASLSVNRHRRVNTLLKITDDYKRAKELLDQNEPALAQSDIFLFGGNLRKC